jgi:FkbM family methyltransferase
MIASFMLRHSKIYELCASLGLDTLYLRMLRLREPRVLSDGEKKPSILEYADGFRMKLDYKDKYDFYYLSQWKESNGSYEVKTSTYLKKILKHGDSFIDGGANAGYYSMFASELIGQEGRVYAFEPAPIPFKKMKKNIQINRLHNIKLYKMGIGDTDKEADFNLSDRDSSGSSFLSLSGLSNTIKVKIFRLDTLFPDGIKSLKAIKLDLEGYENEAIIGAKNLIRKSKPTIIFEFNYRTLFDKDRHYNEVFDSLQKLGYSKFIESETGNSVERYSDLSHLYTNVIALG